MYYSAWEKIGIDKRDILVDRVEETSDAQDKGKKELLTAIDQFKAVVKVEPSELEETYRDLDKAYSNAANAADKIREKIDSVESVAKALFKEWESELGEYSNASLWQKSAKKLDRTKKQYQVYIQSAKKSEAKMDPALRAMYDQVLYLKHNLNMTAIGSIESEVINIDKEVEDILQSIERSIESASQFIKEIS